MIPTRPGCIFCELVHGGAEVSLCYEDRESIAFMDIQPVNVGHLLVVPRVHYDSLDDIPFALAMHLFDVALRLAPIAKRVAGCDGLNIVVNSGESAGQKRAPLSRSRDPQARERRLRNRPPLSQFDGP